MSEHDHHIHDDEPRESDIMKALLYREVAHHGPAAETIHRLRREIEPALDTISHALHDQRPMAAGQQWTIPIMMSCGFEGELVVRVANPGPLHQPRPVIEQGTP